MHAFAHYYTEYWHCLMDSVTLQPSIIWNSGWIIYYWEHILVVHSGICCCLAPQSFTVKHPALSYTMYSGIIAYCMTWIISNFLLMLAFMQAFFLSYCVNESVVYLFLKNLMQVFQVVNKRDSYLRCHHIYTCIISISI